MLEYEPGWTTSYYDDKIEKEDPSSKYSVNSFNWTKTMISEGSIIQRILLFPQE